MKVVIVIFLVAVLSTVYSAPGWSSTFKHKIDLKTGALTSSNATFLLRAIKCISAYPTLLNGTGFNLNTLMKNFDTIRNALAQCNILITLNPNSKFPFQFKNQTMDVIAFEIPQCIQHQKNTTTAVPTTAAPTTAAPTTAASGGLPGR